MMAAVNQNPADGETPKDDRATAEVAAALWAAMEVGIAPAGLGAVRVRPSARPSVGPDAWRHGNFVRNGQKRAT